MTKTIRVFEAFSGIGATRKALENISSKLNIQFIYQGISEIDPYAIQSYEQIHGETKNYGSIQSISLALNLPKIDLFTYTFPCTDISVSGKQKGLKNGEQSSLLWNCKNIISHKNIDYLLMENVANILSKNIKPDFMEWIEYLEDLGYHNQILSLNTKDFGLPMDRNRVFLVSSKYPFQDQPIQPYNWYTTMVCILEESVPLKYYVDEERSDRWLENHLFTQFQTFSCERLGGLYDKDGKRKQAGSIYNKNGLAPSLTTMQGGWRQPIIYDESKNRLRRLTPLECWKCFGFDQHDFLKAKRVCSDTQLYKQIGNSIGVSVLEEVFYQLFKGE